MQSCNTKAATGHLKDTKGKFLGKACKFKSSDDPDDLCSRLETHFKKHNLGTVARRRKLIDMSTMVSVFTACPLVTAENMKTQNKTIVPCHNMHDKQNDDNN